MGDDELERLRAKYAAGAGGEIHDPAFRRVADTQFVGDRRAWPFAGVATLCGAPYRPEAPDLPDFGGLQAALVGVPMDLGVTNRAGARRRPGRGATGR